MMRSSDLAVEYAGLAEWAMGAMRPDLSEREFDELALAIHRFQKRYNAPYANLCAKRPEPTTWSEIPAVPQSVFKTYRLSTFPPQVIAKTFRTSGTTGEGYGEHHFYKLDVYETSIVRGWDLLGLPAAPQIILAPAPTDAPQSSLSYMLWTLRARSPAGVQLFAVARRGAIETARIATQIQRWTAEGYPIAVLGTALAYLRFFELLGTTTYTLPPGSFAMETGGFKGSGRNVAKAELYEMFGRFLGLGPDVIHNEYGMTELSSQCYSRGLGRVHETPPWMRAVVIDPETGTEAALGGTGVLRLYDLANLTSVLAVDTQDLAVRRERRFELLGRDPTAIPRGCSRSADELVA